MLSAGPAGLAPSSASAKRSTSGPAGAAGSPQMSGASGSASAWLGCPRWMPCPQPGSGSAVGSSSPGRAPSWPAMAPNTGSSPAPWSTGSGSSPETSRSSRSSADAGAAVSSAAGAGASVMGGAGVGSSSKRKTSSSTAGASSRTALPISCLSSPRVAASPTPCLTEAMSCSGHASMPSGNGSGVGSTASSPAITRARKSRTSRSTILPPSPEPCSRRQSTLFCSASRRASGVMSGSLTGVLLRAAASPPLVSCLVSREYTEPMLAPHGAHLSDISHSSDPCQTAFPRPADRSATGRARARPAPLQGRQAWKNTPSMYVCSSASAP